MNKEPGRIRNAQNKNIEFQYDIEKLKKENRYRVQGTAFPQSTKRFNWGACMLTPIWGFFHNKLEISLISIVLIFVPIVGIWFAMIFSIYCGTQGNEWAWESNKWKKIEEMHEAQKKWAMWGVIIELVTIIVISAYTMKFIQSFNPNITEEQIIELQEKYGL